MMVNTSKVIENDFHNANDIVTPSKIPKVMEIITPTRVSSPKIGDNQENLAAGNKVETKEKPQVDVIHGNSDLNRGMVMEFVGPKVVNGEVDITIEETYVKDELHYQEPALILFVVGETLSMNDVKKFMEKVQNFVSLLDLYYNEISYFIVRFKSIEDRGIVMIQGPYFIYGVPLFLRNWAAEFEIREDLMCVVPLWITLPQLPLHLWGEKSISKIASVVGN